MSVVGRVVSAGAMAIGGLIVLQFGTWISPPRWRDGRVSYRASRSVMR